MNIYRLQSEEELELLQSRIKSRSKDIKVHESVVPPSRVTSLERLLTPVKTPKKRLRAVQNGPRSTFEHQLLCRQLIQAKIAYREEFRFEPKRRWRADFFIPQGNFIVEIVGGVWLKKGGHTGGQAQIDDMSKFNNAYLLGFGVLQFTPQQVNNGEALSFIERALRLTPARRKEIAVKARQAQLTAKRT